LIKKRSDSRDLRLTVPLKLEERPENRQVAETLPGTLPIVEERPECNNGPFLIFCLLLLGKKGRRNRQNDEENDKKYFLTNI